MLFVSTKAFQLIPIQCSTVFCLFFNVKFRSLIAFPQICMYKIQRLNRFSFHVHAVFLKVYNRNICDDWNAIFAWQGQKVLDVYAFVKLNPVKQAFLVYAINTSKHNAVVIWWQKYVLNPVNLLNWYVQFFAYFAKIYN